ncbi:MAG: thiamine diphosphokinase [Elusimicrobiota bacterium]
MTSVLLLLNGELPRPARVRALAREASLVVCADGGLRHAVRLRVRAQVVIGDMDSLPSPLPRWKETTYLCDFDEETSDFEKALRFVARLGADAVWVAGALGGRLDHLLANLAVAERCAGRIPIALVDDGAGSAQLVGPGAYAFDARRGRTVSMVPAGRGCLVTTRGLRRELRREAPRPGGRGLAERAAGSRVDIRVHRGRLWIVRSGPGPK